MKKILLAVLAVVAIASGFTDAHAQSPVAGRQRFENVRFQTSAAANDGGGVVDSLVARRVGAAGASSVLDTTKAISMRDWLRPFGSHTGGATDTSQVWLTLMLNASVDTGDDGCESGADSIYVAMQVSVDGKAWLTAAAIPGQTVSAGTNPITTRNDQTILNGAFKGALSLNGAALANGQPVWIYRYRFRGINQLANLDCDNAFIFPYVRFVLSFPDAKGYKVAGKVGYFTGAGAF